MKNRSRRRHKAPDTRPPGGPVFVSPEGQKRMSLDNSHSNTTARYAHITQVVRQSGSERIERLLDGFQLRWEEGV